ncbi:MAG: 16S rRNA (cytosine(1402)-N(4))-methyltransferase RsmH [Oscillospiraceae bacterium]|nr:16S rRNA (cytosine(1402)-N(4))-methyltransferase RsmH [Oscillospiraceae bacterium]
MEHIPALLRETIEGLNIKPNGIYIDGTLGRGGHCLEIVKRLTTGKVIAIDCDSQAIEESKEKLSKYQDKIKYVHGNFGGIASILCEENVEKADGMIFDLGVSSAQLDDGSRGFSYMQDAKLDMRMDKENTLTAFEIVNNWREDELRKIFFDYGQEKYSKAVAREIVKKRSKKTVETTFELNEIILAAMPPFARREKQHPSKRCFQALRIAVGDELGILAKMLETAPQLLKIEGRICVISFHSLEDKIVKKTFADHAKQCICPEKAPICSCGKKPILKLITRKPIIADSLEIEANPRVRSAKLRIAQRI